jgi:hypothetical protein
MEVKIMEPEDPNTLATDRRAITRRDILPRDSITLIIR